MKSLVVYDSLYGNTEKIARAIAEAIGGELRVAGEVVSDDLDWELLAVGSPTQGGRPTVAVREFIKGIPPSGLQRADVVTFDTRLAAGEQGFALRILMGIIGYAAPKIAKALTSKGGNLVAEPAGFVVDGKEGPIRPGELERAAAWASSLSQRPLRG